MSKTRFCITMPLLIIVFCTVFSCKNNDIKPEYSPYDLHFNGLAKSWDEGMPLGNAIIGALVWDKDNKLRISLDRADLWDLRPSDSLSGINYKFNWVYDQVMKRDYLPVQQKFDHPYDNLPAPSKIPGAGLEFSLSGVGSPDSVRLFLNNALCEVYWGNGMYMQTFVHATEPVGWFRIENAVESFLPELIPPVYNSSGEVGEDMGPVTGQDLRRLGYTQGTVNSEENMIKYHQKGWGGFYYDVAVKWKKEGNTITGTWSITSSLIEEKAADIVDSSLKRGILNDYRSHIRFWNDYWAQSSVNLPDDVLARQYAREMYKFGSAAREYSYPISLQAVWTADNGKLPPWKGDYHHDLNTQLSYWPCYTGNHLREGLGYINTLWNQKETNKRYTKQYFEKEGLNVPGVATLLGEPMAGWIQYSLSPTVSAWLSQHFYLHYKYSADKEFLKEKAYPYIKDVAVFLEQMTYIDSTGTRRLPISSSPEIYDNSIRAWFHTITNYDLALIRFVFSAASELAAELSLSGEQSASVKSSFSEESVHWKGLLNQLPDFDLDESGGLTFAKGFPYNESHRHFSNSMAIHPLGIIDWNSGKNEKDIIKATIKNFENIGPDYWCGYSYSWFGNIKARAMDGEGAAEALRTFANCFCLKNTFHANGDQTNSGKSRFTYRPFTLEGNFAFASGVQEMLLQSHTGIIRVFPAIPASWKNVSFKNLRAYGAFLVSAEIESGNIKHVTVKSEKGGLLRIANPFGSDIIEIHTVEGQMLEF